MDLASSIQVPNVIGGTTPLYNQLNVHPSPAWKLRLGAVDRMIAHYNLVRPIVVLPATHYGPRAYQLAACHTTGLDVNGLLVHCIVARAEAHPCVVDEYLWHEFTHAHQIERHGNGVFDMRTIHSFAASYNTQSSLYGYGDNSYEREARQAQLNAGTIPLTEPSGIPPSWSAPLTTLKFSSRVPIQYIEDDRKEGWYGYNDDTFASNPSATGTAMDPWRDTGSGATGDTRPWGTDSQWPNLR